MANFLTPVPLLAKRECGVLPEIKSKFYNSRLNAAKSLYRRDLVCHFGCVNAIEFSSNGELLISGGDDRRVMLWKFGQAIVDAGKPEPMKGQHHSNIFCLGITNDNQKIYSGGNDETVIVHDVESKRPLEILQHQRAVCGLSINPFNQMVVTTAGNDGRLLLFDTRLSVHELLVISRSRKAFHSVMYHPLQSDVLVSSNARDGISLWDLRSPKHPAIRYLNNTNSVVQSGMSARFNATGSHILALRRRLPPVLYDVKVPDPVASFFHQDYYNSCTMKSCCFAGENEQFVLSGSDDFNLYMWKIPEGYVRVSEGDQPIEKMAQFQPHLILHGHRSIVNQVRYNPQYSAIASSGVEKIIKIWSPMEYPKMSGSIQSEAGSDRREIYSHEDYVSLMHHSGQFISQNYSDQSTREDPRMMAFFDSLVQRELECVMDDTDSCDGTTSDTRRSDSSDDGQHYFVPKRQTANGNRQRCINRLARLVAMRYSKNGRTQKRGTHRRIKQPRAVVKPAGKCVSKRALTRSCLLLRRATPRAPRAAPRGTPRAAVSGPSSDRSDTDEPSHCHFRSNTKSIRSLRRRMTLSRATKRKPKTTYRKSSLRNNGAGMSRDNDDTNVSNSDNNFDQDLTLPSTSTGYRGPNTLTLFKITEADSDDDQCPTPTLVPTTGSNSTPRLRTSSLNDNMFLPEPRPRRRRTWQLSDSSDTSPHIEANSSMHFNNTRLIEKTPQAALDDSISCTPTPRYNRTVARLMNETNESELESSCSSRNADRDAELAKPRQRAKKTRRNYRNRVTSDSN